MTTRAILLFAHIPNCLLVVVRILFFIVPLLSSEHQPHNFSSSYVKLLPGAYKRESLRMCGAAICLFEQLLGS